MSSAVRNDTPIKVGDKVVFMVGNFKGLKGVYVGMEGKSHVVRSENGINIQFFNIQDIAKERT